jgi:hypothetical protein
LIRGIEMCNIKYLYKFMPIAVPYLWNTSTPR